MLFSQDNQAFRYILDGMRLQPVQDISSMGADPAHELIILMGETGDLARVPGGAKSFVEKGGALFVATDRASHPTLQRDFRIRVSGLKVLITDIEQAYRGAVNCPIVEARKDDPPIFQGLSRVATNRASFLTLSNLSEALAVFPDGCVVERLPFAPGAYKGGRLPFAIGKTTGKGRLLVLSDHSVFINEMMMQQENDNDNFDFAYNCLDWLTESGHRRQVYFEFEGAVVSDFNVPLLPPGRLPDLTGDIMDKLGAAIEDDGLLDKILYEHLDQRHFLAGLLIGLTLLIAVFGLHRLSQSIQEPLDSELSTVTATPDTAVGALVSRRHEAMLRHGNLSEAAGELARHALADIGAPLTGEHVPIEPSSWPPRIIVQGGWRQCRQLREMVMHFWQLANSQPASRVSPRQYSRLVRQAAQLRAAYHQGRLRLDKAEDSA
jgi:hypothetical protein